jgi:hypothetical protein
VNLTDFRNRMTALLPVFSVVSQLYVQSLVALCITQLRINLSVSALPESFDPLEPFSNLN